MVAPPSRWACPPYDVSAAARLAAALGVSQPVAAVLVRRGLAEPAAARRFLAAADRHDPASLPGVPAAVALLLRHLERGSRIAVFGDYDVDGVCSTAMLLGTLRALGADPRWQLPSRFEDGYGLSRSAVARLAREGTELLVTVDCGVTAVAEVAAARAAGMDVIVVDHHRPGPASPDCVVVHPAPDGAARYPTPELCGAGVVLKLTEALLAAAGRDPVQADEGLELAALASVCDVVPLRGENRRIVRAGLDALARTRRPGLRALMRVADLDPGQVDERALGFRLGPRLNAAGRMQRADAALELLLTEDERRAEEVARELDALNRDRQEAETRILFQADAACAVQASAAALVVAGEGWHPGVVGIVASRLVERWRRPCVAIALPGGSAGEPVGGRGSGRSIPPYDLHAGLAASASHLIRFGGHRAAAGLEIDAGEIDAFRAALARHAAAALSPADLLPCEQVDAVVSGDALGLPLAEELEALRPFGMGNRQPTLLVPAARVEGLGGMGEGRHARFTVVTGGARSRGVAFGSPPRALAAAGERPHDLALRLEPNRWNGTVEPRVVLRALCPTKTGRLRVLGEEGSFWERLARELERDPEAERPAHSEPGSPRARADGRAAGADGGAAGGDGRAAGTGPAGARAGADVIDRRGEGLAGTAGDLLTSGEPVLIAVADVPRRREALESLVAGLVPDGAAVVGWGALAAQPELAAGFAHLLAFDPPPGGERDPLLTAAPLAHLAWGAAEVAFALFVWRAELDLRPALADAWRALRKLAPDCAPVELAAALRGAGPYPRSPETGGRLLRVLRELRLVHVALEPPGSPRCRTLDAAPTDLGRSPSYRAYLNRLAARERALGGGGGVRAAPAVATP